jgi:hypothetical protein
MKLVASAGLDGTIKIWNMECKLIRYPSIFLKKIVVDYKSLIS